MKEVRIGLIGTGYIGKAHAIAYAQAPTVFELRGKLVREMVAEVSPALAAQRAQAFGFNRFTCDWRELVADPAIDVVDICSPNYLHKEMALAAIHHGKHVYAEKPLALNARDASEMAAAATRAGVIHFYGTHNEDYMADPNTPIHWHCLQATAGLGTLGDLAAHIVSMAQYLVGEITQVCGDLKTVVVTRPASVGSSARVAVENEDQAHAMVRFVNGAQGVIEASRVACGRKMGLSYMITGTQGAISFTQERMAELKLYLHNDPVNRQGFRTLLVGPTHPEYAAFCMAAGHGIGFNDQKTVEVRDLIDGIAMDTPLWPDFAEGWKVSRILDAIALSHQDSRWVNVTDIV
ncbi:Gfo/Idh/MocA family protein [Yersinia pseudotuberculosis]|uniref:Gfo/Idh/MocA family protein n=1 Tax=Yersinia pseudotuberculosis TaxID=633 RepID=UPI0005E691EC|nr:Gfo/Idh/MocA family oxidoreductase [Yersinia pseudotuberculosis]CFQ75824.1 oxidoreductase domain-containing protein [Yersinia pseudotuberculosis]